MGYKKIFEYDNHKKLLHKTTNTIFNGYNTYKAAVGFIPTQINRTFRNVLVSKDLGIISKSASSIYGTYESYKSTLGDITRLNTLDFDSSLLNILERTRKLENSNKVKLIIETKEDGTTNIIKMNIENGKTHLLKKINYDYKDYLLDEIAKVVYFFTKDKVIIERL
ncbi:hypothetical protein [Aquimarina sp. 2201CG5-10]|uniref:hypothetical protein n=1 Tax=Aquimarina callyspongiae TaxID=3098150 RepID=UPI002AB434B0|nr:hypothetical protein [Aquimarina sp. 2201CG5-10]MDY8134672.1 hypothetical protein [Aquimarina sp. 2201CG5-10]